MRLHVGVCVALAGALLAACDIASTEAPAGAAHTKTAGIDPAPPTTAVPPAVCGPGSQPETGLQGQVTMEDRQSGRSQQGYRCNLELKGQYQGEGASWQFAWYDDCGYYDTKNAATQEHAGVVVVDAHDPEHPVASAFLDTPAMLDPWESLKVNEKRALLGAVHGSGGALTPGALGPEFDVYELAGDCKHPKLASTTSFAGTLGHEGSWAPDGMTYYGTNGTGNVIGQLNAIDVSDPAHPQLLLADKKYVHGLSISDDGNRAYLASTDTNGLMIVDTSAIQSRGTAPSIPQVSVLTWADGTLGQHSIPVTIKGKPYLIFVDEGGRGAGRIIDISDEANPVVVSKLKLEVHLEQNAGIDVRDTGGGTPLFVYDGHYCGVDQQHEPTVVGCGYFESGIRVFDIRDPVHPKEIAYYNPPAIPVGKAGAGSQHGGGTADHCSAQVRFVKERGELWTTCQDNGFMILKFTNDVWPFKSDAVTPPVPNPAPAPAAVAATASTGRFGGTLGFALLTPLFGFFIVRRSRRC